MAYLYLDVETLQTTNSDVIADLESKITAPGQYKKPDSIAEWIKENHDSELEKLVSQTSFNALHGSIACICFALDDDEVQAVSTKDQNELAMLTEFYEILLEKISEDRQGGNRGHRDLVVVGHNVVGFDLPFIKQRSIINGIRPPTELQLAMSAKPWDKYVQDTMLLWSTDSQKRVSMDSLCRAFNIPGKGDFDGSKVNSEWTTGSKTKVIDYCRMDVVRTREIYKRITFSH